MRQIKGRRGGLMWKSDRLPVKEASVGLEIWRNFVEYLTKVDIWEERKVFGSHWQVLKEELLKNLNGIGKSITYEMKPLAGGDMIQKLISGYVQDNDGHVNEDAIFGKCRTVISFIEKLEKESGAEFNLDCVGSAFTAKGRMECPNCRHICGNWFSTSSSRDQLGSEEMATTQQTQIEEQDDENWQVQDQMNEEVDPQWQELIDQMSGQIEEAKAYFSQYSGGAPSVLSSFKLTSPPGTISMPTQAPTISRSVSPVRSFRLLPKDFEAMTPAVMLTTTALESTSTQVAQSRYEQLGKLLSGQMVSRLPDQQPPPHYTEEQPQGSSVDTTYTHSSNEVYPKTSSAAEVAAKLMTSSSSAQMLSYVLSENGGLFSQQPLITGPPTMSRQ